MTRSKKSSSFRITLFVFILLISFMAQAQNNRLLVQKYSLRPYQDILRDLYFLKQRERSGEEINQPMVTVMPVNKLPVSGFVLDYKDDKDEHGVVLELYNSTDVLFLELYGIVGVTIHEADKAAYLLVDLTVADIQTTATRLDVKVKISKATEKLKEKIGPIKFVLADEDMPSNGQQLFLTSLFITDITIALMEIAKTDLGKASIQNTVNTVHIKKGKTLDAKLDNGVLTLAYDFQRSYTTNYARQDLVEKIYNAL